VWPEGLGKLKKFTSSGLKPATLCFVAECLNHQPTACQQQQEQQHWCIMFLGLCCRVLHNGYLYRFIHKRHHEWIAPIAVTAMYCHPIESIFSNMVPIFLGVFIMGSHVATAWLWFSLAILFTLNAHSGYHLPFLPSPEFHDFHHLK
jgi:hypothetical protein